MLSSFSCVVCVAGVYATEQHNFSVPDNVVTMKFPIDASIAKICVTHRGAKKVASDAIRFLE